MLTKDDLHVGHMYSAKRPRRTSTGKFNDRCISAIKNGIVFYRTPVSMKKFKPCIEQPIADFLKEVREDVTHLSPIFWRKWEDWR